ncbi:TetR family transcriptional regulator C-terminal domain-containing protein, partial [Mesorhizobium sp.]|uniref:TetR family transcriptional regulator C-terminal domain-containing protein n=1 Tax=Mesorhizobium sp. TaxID=1871066 RepID=UPI00257CA2D9
PGMKVCASPPGWPWVNELIGVAWRHPNLWIGLLAVRPSLLVKAHSGYEPLLQYGRTLLQDRIIFGTAFPMLAPELALGEAGCSYGVVSFHFKSKEGITLAALDHVVEEYDRNLNRPEFGSPVARLLGMIALDFDTEMSNPGHIAVFTAFWAESVRNPEYQRRCAELKARYDAVVKADIAALAERRGLDLDAAMVARSLNAMIDGLWISGQIFGTSGPAARKMAKKACLFYLKAIFPDDF